MNLRPKYHFTAKENWINDPNGFSKYNDRYHLFYQYNPCGTKWGNMSWGHAVSDDLFHWEHMEPVMYPDREYDKDGVYSGSAIQVGDMHHVFYTGHAYVSEDCLEEVQCHASSTDGIVYKKDGNNPVIMGTPETVDANDFRDPKIWFRDGKYYMIVGGCLNHRGRAVVYVSDELSDWKYFAVFEKPDFGTMWECPDIFEIEGQLFMVISAMGMGAHDFMNEVFIAPCSMDYENGKTWIGEFERMDYGKNMYAPQSLNYDGGDTVFVGWMMMKEPFNSSCNWTGMFTLPRKIMWINQQLHYKPHDHIKQLMRETEIRKEQEILLSDNTYVLRFSAKTGYNWSVQLLSNGEQYCLLGFDTQRKTICLDRSKTLSGTDALKDMAEVVYTPTLSKETIEMEVVVDRSIVEIFVDGGRYVISMAVCPAENQKRISVEDDHAQLNDIRLFLI